MNKNIINIPKKIKQIKVPETISVINEEATYSPLISYTGKQTRAFRNVSNKNKVTETKKVAGKSVQMSMFKSEIENTELVIKGYEKLKATLGINTDKLLTMLIIEFTKLNDHKNKNKPLVTDISINFREYAKLVGKKLSVDEKKNTETLREFYKQVKADLGLLSNTSIKIEDKATNSFIQLKVLGSHGVSVKENIIFASLDNVFSKTIREQPLTSIPRGLFTIDGRKRNSWTLGIYMAEHYNKPNNNKINTHDRLRVETLLKYVDLPKYEDIKSDRSWRNELKDKLESYLDELKAHNVIDKWEYRTSKNKKAKNPSTYAEWKELRVHFDIIESVYFEEKQKENKIIKS